MLKQLIGIGLLLGVLAACTFDSDVPLIPTTEVIQPLPNEAGVQLFSQDQSDPTKWSPSDETELLFQSHGYWLGDNEMFLTFSALDETDRMIVQIAIQPDDPGEEESFLFGIARKVGSDKVFFTIPSPELLPDDLKRTYNCEAGDWGAYNCPGIDTYAEMKSALQKVERFAKYNGYLQIEAR